MAEVIAQLVGAVSFTQQETAAFPHIRWHVGSGPPPSDVLGVDGDLYLDSSTGDIFQKENGTWA